MDSEYAIRIAVIEDAPAIAGVNHQTWLYAYRGLIPDSDLDSLNLDSLTERWKQNLKGADSRSGTFVAVDGHSVVAYSRFYPSVDPDDNTDRVATIGSMYVNPEFHGKGIGRQLMGAVLESAKRHGFTEATLHILAGNTRARKFYEELGWERDLNAEISGSEEETVPKVRYRRRPL